MQIDKMQNGYVAVNIYDDDGRINFEPVCIRRDGKGSTTQYSFSDMLVLSALLEECKKKYLQS